jgi:transposase
VTQLCLDEIAPHKGHGNYKLIISAPELGLILDVLADRRKETLEAWLDERGTAWCAAVEACCADMWDAYHLAAHAKLPNAKVVVDRFHLMKNLNDALTTARRTLQKQAATETKARLKGSRWLLVKNAKMLTAEERHTLQQVLDASPELQRSYQLKEEFRQLLDETTDSKTAAVALDTWLEKVRLTSLKSLLAFTNTVQNWRCAILNYFDTHLTNGFAEGVNLKIKLLIRQAFGYRNFSSLRLHILLAFPST